MNALAKPAVSERELLLTRVFDAPVELVWQAWTQKPHLEKWLAPHTVTIAAVTVETSSEGMCSGSRLVARSRTVQKPTEASAHSA